MNLSHVVRVHRLLLVAIVGLTHLTLIHNDLR